MKVKISRASNRIKDYKYFITNNLSYKFISLFIALILWVSILGRRDFVTTKQMEVLFLTSSNYSVIGQSVDRIKVKVSGSQPLMKKFKERSINLTIDATENKDGIFEFDITQSLIDLPRGLRILSIKPNSIRVQISEKNN
jgi:YbbR domain-containing protein